MSQVFKEKICNKTFAHSYPGRRSIKHAHPATFSLSHHDEASSYIIPSHHLHLGNREPCKRKVTDSACPKFLFIFFTFFSGLFYLQTFEKKLGRIR